MLLINGKPAVLVLYERGLRSPMPAERRQASRALRQFGDIESARLLLAALGAERDPALRSELEEMFRQWEAPEAARAYSEALRTAPDAPARTALAQRLGALLNGRTAELLLDEFTGEIDDRDFRQAVATMFTNSSSPAAAESLAAFLRASTDGATPAYFSEATARIGSYAVVSAMLDAYRRGAPPASSEAFATAFAGTSHPEAVSAFAEALGNANDPANVWQIASACLAALGTPEAANALIKQIQLGDPGGERYRTMLGDLGRVNNPMALDTLRQALAASPSDPALARALEQAIRHCEAAGNARK